MNRVHPGNTISEKEETERLVFVREVEYDERDVEGSVFLYKTERDGNKPYLANARPSYFLVHEIEETRYTHDLKPFRSNTNTRYHVWSVDNKYELIEDETRTPEPYMIEEEDIPAPNAHKAAKKYARD
jgi:hypothetical protein